jgi:hypothetical protein
MMEHPFILNLSDKTVDELQNTISSLTNKLTFAYRSGNQPLVNQLNMAIASYKKEYAKKMDDLVKKKDLGDKINIQKEK